MDQEIQQLLREEEQRQRTTINLIASENYTSEAILSALGSVAQNKYAEGYPGARWYAGTNVIDDIERLAKSRALKLFGLAAGQWHVNVQPYSGSPANIAVYLALLQPGDTVLAMHLDAGGHLTHGSPVNFSGKTYRFVHYGVGADGRLDYDQIEKLALRVKPKLIISGASAYPRIIDFTRFGRMARKSGALHLADIAHIAGLIAGKVHPSPFPHADIVTTTTHKTLRGPRGGVIFCRTQFAKKIDAAVFPELQGGPHEHQIAAKAVCFLEASKPEFRAYVKHVVRNAKILAETLKKRGLKIVTDGTDNHLLIIDLRTCKLTGQQAQDMLESAGIVTNKEVIPDDPQPPSVASGIRLGTPATTTLGMKEREMEQIGNWIAEILTDSTNDEVVKKIKKESAILAGRLVRNISN